MYGSNVLCNMPCPCHPQHARHHVLFSSSLKHTTTGMAAQAAPGSSARPHPGVVPPEVHEQHGVAVIHLAVAIHLTA